MNSSKQKKLDKLRLDAEQLMVSRSDNKLESSGADHLQIVHNLQVHQIELEMQNDELRKIQSDLLDSHKELTKNNSLLDKLYHLSPVAYVMLDKVGKINQANISFSQLVDQPLHKINGDYLSSFVTEKDKVVFTSRFPAFYKIPEHKQLDLRLYNKVKNTSSHVIMKGVLIPENDTDFGLLLSITDVTALKKAEESAQKSQQIAEKANRAKSEFLSQMSHELRTPLNAILGFSQIIQMDDKLEQEDKENVEQIYVAGKHLLALINEVLDIAKIDAGHIELDNEALSLNEVINASCILIKPLLEKNNIQLNIELNGDISLYSDSLKLKQILINLFIKQCD